MKTTPEGIELIKRFEGLELEAYKDSAGVWSIGYGQTGGIRKGQVISKERAEMMLHARVTEIEKDLTFLIKVAINPNQISALVSLIYNIGSGAFARSTLRRYINLEMWQVAADQFLRWDRAGGQTLRGLQIRRQAERELFLKPYPSHTSLHSLS